MTTQTDDGTEGRSELRAWLDRAAAEPWQSPFPERRPEIEELREESTRVVALAERWMENPETQPYGRALFDAINGDE
ncbi:hypothetical protein ACFY2K_42550 [Kitasatospora sp. NPDC001309]|uniref:hypothetical protein n=1 Tax=Kitasatospora sp. NPDC001309 TaxID=3364013 RepID=UPI0036978866